MGYNNFGGNGQWNNQGGFNNLQGNGYPLMMGGGMSNDYLMHGGNGMMGGDMGMDFQMGANVPLQHEAFAAVHEPPAYERLGADGQCTVPLLLVSTDAVLAVVPIGQTHDNLDFTAEELREMEKTRDEDTDEDTDAGDEDEGNDNDTEDKNENKNANNSDDGDVSDNNLSDSDEDGAPKVEAHGPGADKNEAEEV